MNNTSDPNEYQFTGKQIPLKVNELVAFVHQKLEQYDNLVKETKSVPFYSPYAHPIIYTTPEGKTVQIPKEIQQQAIDQWTSATKQGKVRSEMPPIPSYQEMPDIEEELVKDKYNKKKKELEESVDNKKILYIMIGLLIIACIYLYSKQQIK